MPLRHEKKPEQDAVQDTNNGRYYDSTVTVIPAANIYYEDSFLTYEKIKNLIASVTANTSGTIPGSLFIDGKGVNGVTLTDYQNQGPNNEVYLLDGQGISLITCATTSPRKATGCSIPES